MDEENGGKKKERTLEEINADISALDEKIGELDSMRTQLIIEHDEAVRDRVPRIF